MVAFFVLPALQALPRPSSRDGVPSPSPPSLAPPGLGCGSFAKPPHKSEDKRVPASMKPKSTHTLSYFVRTCRRKPRAQPQAVVGSARCVSLRLSSAMLRSAYVRRARSHSSSDDGDGGAAQWVDK
jgi:hypothetical protein